MQLLSNLNNQLVLLKALKELEVTEDETLKYLSPKYKALIANEKEIQAEFDSMPSYLDRLYGINFQMFPFISIETCLFVFLSYNSILHSITKHEHLLLDYANS